MGAALMLCIVSTATDAWARMDILESLVAAPGRPESLWFKEIDGVWTWRLGFPHLIRAPNATDSDPHLVPKALASAIKPLPSSNSSASSLSEWDEVRRPATPTPWLCFHARKVLIRQTGM